jgi:hypothetical protein
VLLTRSRLCPRPKPGSSLHLHVLSTPPAFVLSQDQTLRKRLAWIFSGTSNGCRLHKSRESCHIRTDGRHSYTCASLGLTGLTQTASSRLTGNGGSNLDAIYRVPDWDSVIARC